MAEQRETRLLTGGMDSDSAPFAVGKDALLNAVNMRAVSSKQQRGGDGQFIEGNTAVPLIGSLPAGNNTLLGKCVDNEAGEAFWFYHNGAGNHFIGRLTTQGIVSANGAFQIILANATVAEGLNFQEDAFIDCRCANGLLVWTDNINPVRYLNTRKAYSGSATLSQAELSLVVEPGFAPAISVRGAPNPNVGVSVQDRPLQFTYRVSNTDGMVSVMAPYSLTLPPVRDSQKAGNPFFGNTANMGIRLQVKFPANWRTIDFIVRYTDTNSFFVIKTFSNLVTADVVAVNRHNDGLANLAFNGWFGNTLEAIDSTTIAKQFDSIPITSAHLELAANRLLLARNKEGYDTPAVRPTVTVTQNRLSTDIPSSVGPYQAYMLIGQQAERYNTEYSLWYYTVVILYDGRHYVLPPDCGGAGIFLAPVGSEAPADAQQRVGNPANISPLDIGYIWNLPTSISKNSLSLTPVIGNLDLNQGPSSVEAITILRRAVIETANGIRGGWSAAAPFSYKLPHGLIYIQDNPNEFININNVDRLFAPNNTYRLGIQYYDSALRKSGVQFLQDMLIPVYGVNPLSGQHSITTSVAVSLLKTPGSIPDWATCYSLAISRNQKANRLYSFAVNIIKVAVKNQAGNILLGGVDYLNEPLVSGREISGRPPGYAIYGLAVPLQSLVQYGYGYEYVEGDYIELVGLSPSGTSNTSVISGRILSVYKGHAVISYDQSKYPELQNVVCAGSNSIVFTRVGINYTARYNTGPAAPDRQYTVLAILYSGTTAIDNSMFEIAKFGTITNPGLPSRDYGPFVDSLSSTATINGDMFSQPRGSEAGGRVGFAMTPYEVNPMVVVNDTGRITLTDTVGQQVLSSAVRWSDTRIPGSNTNGYGSFGVGNYKQVEQTAGDINGIVLTTKGVQEGGQLVIVCSSGSFTALVSKQQVFGADQGQVFISESADVLGTVNPIKGRWGCISPRSIVEYQGNVFWADVPNRDIIEFSQAGANPVSQFKCSRLWQELFGNFGALAPNRIDPGKVSCGVNPYTSELMVRVPAPVNPKVKPDLPTSNFADPFDSVYYDSRTYIYNWAENKWVGSWESTAESVNIGDDVFSWNFGGMWKEFNNTPGFYYGQNKVGLLAIPFNGNFPDTKIPLNVIISADSIPTEAYAVVPNPNNPGDISVAKITGSPYNWRNREGDIMGVVSRDRLSNNAATSDAYDLAGIRGPRLKGKVVSVALFFFGGSGAGNPFVSSATLVYNKSSGH